MTQYLTLQRCLFDAFANPDYSDPQDKAQMWAIVEGMRRIDPHSYEWRSVTARKDHECIRECHIAKRSTYFKRMIGAGWGSDWKFCASCMAMILYFKEVDKMPPHLYTHWDIASQRPVHIEEIDPSRSAPSE